MYDVPKPTMAPQIDEGESTMHELWSHTNRNAYDVSDKYEGRTLQLRRYPLRGDVGNVATTRSTNQPSETIASSIHGQAEYH